jgi:lysozyme family protein
MRENFEQALRLVLVHEGGFVNHPKDPGGATNKGVTQRTYDAWRRNSGRGPQSVVNITVSEVSAIYRRQYWDAVRADDLPPGLDYAVFDFAVNSGPARAAQFLQRQVGVEADGIIGAITLSAVGEGGVVMVRQLCQARLAWLKRLPHWGTFGRGWARRVSEVQAVAVEWAEPHFTLIEGGAATAPARGKATGPEKHRAVAADTAKDWRAWLAGGSGILGAVSPLLEASGPLQWAVSAAIVLGAVAGVYLLVRQGH